MLPLIAIVMVILFVAAVLAIDIARVHVTRSELRTATDAAARAGVEALGREQSRSAAVDAAMAVARKNVVAGKGLSLDPDNILFGVATENKDGTFEFKENGGSAINAVRVVGSRAANSPDGPVNMLFGRLFGQDVFEPVQSATATRLDRDIALVLDKSGSMQNFGRFEALLNGLDVFLAELETTSQKENVSLTAYDEFPEKLVDMTPDLVAISNAMRDQKPGGFTGIGRGLQTGLDSIRKDRNAREFSLKSIVLMTDGNQNRGPGPEKIAEKCQKEGVVVHTITFSQGADRDLMKKVASITGGIHLHAENNAELVSAFQTIAKQIQVLLIE
jgi:Mg-chelatase subunit ChlD